MASGPDEILDAGLSEDDPNFLDELERRANDTAPTIPLAELWQQD